MKAPLAATGGSPDGTYGAPQQPPSYRPWSVCCQALMQDPPLDAKGLTLMQYTQGRGTSSVPAPSPK